MPPPCEYVFDVVCEGSTHRVSWSPAQGLDTLHHDSERELTLLALGAEARGCADVLLAWKAVLQYPPVQLLEVWYDDSLPQTSLGAERGTQDFRRSVERLILGRSLAARPQWTKAVVGSLPVEARRRLVWDVLDALEASGDGEASDVPAMRQRFFGRRVGP